MDVKRITLKTKILSMVFVLLALIVLSAIIALNIISSIGEELKEVAEIDIPLTETITEITENQLERGIWFERILRYADSENESQKFEQAVQEFKKHAKPMEEELKAGKQIAANAVRLAVTEDIRNKYKDIEKTLLEIEQGLAAYEQNINNIINKFEQGEHKEAFTLAEKAGAEEEELDHKIDKFLKSIEKFIDEYLRVAEEQEQSGFVYLIIIAICSVAFGLAFSLRVAQTLLRQIGGEPAVIQNIASQVALGHFDIEQSDSKTTGIYSELIQMSESLKDAIKVIQNTMDNIATGDFTYRIDEEKMTGELSIIANAINNSVKMLSDTILQVSNTSEQINIGAQQLSSTSQALANGTTEQASSLEQISSSMSEIGSKAKTNTENAVQASVLTSQTLEIVKRGNKQMEQMLSSMDKINNSSTDISKIIKVIDEIAFQTNLLALNAAVEAARAGKYGKGFAVVAEEVRNLAGRSTQAAKNTTELIENSVKEVDLGVSNAGKTAEILNEINTSIAKANDLVDEITSASKEQQTGTDEINAALAQVNSVIQQNSSISEETAAASEELNGQSICLRELMDRFKLKPGQQQAKDTVDEDQEAQKKNDPQPIITQPPTKQQLKTPVIKQAAIPVEQQTPPLKTPAIKQAAIPVEQQTKKQRIITLDDDNFGKY